MIREVYCLLMLFFLCIVAPLNAQKSAQEVKSVRNVMKQYAQVYIFAEEYAKAAENILQDTNAFTGFFSTSATVIIDHPYWYYEPKGNSNMVNVSEYCRYFSKYHHQYQLFFQGITIRNIKIEKCKIEGQDMVFEIGIDKIIDFRDEVLSYSRHDTCKEVLFVRDADGHLSVEKVTIKESPFHSVQREVKEAGVRVAPAEMPLENSPKLQKQIKVLMKIMKDVEKRKNKPRGK